jgi:hypothetical protein
MHQPSAFAGMTQKAHKTSCSNRMQQSSASGGNGNLSN